METLKKIVFRPLRRVKKTSKIVVASYSQWSKLSTANYNNFNLVVNDEYRTLPSEEYVYDHKGQELFFFTYNPWDIPVFTHNPLLSLDQIRQGNERYGISWDGVSVNYNARGMDCNGTPTFSHYTIKKILNAEYKGMNIFEPLTVGTVVKWLGWFLYQLEKSNLQIGK